VEQAELLEKKYLGQKPTKLEFSKKGEIALKDFDPLFFGPKYGTVIKITHLLSNKCLTIVFLCNIII
jgi:hypothetical protein